MSLHSINYNTQNKIIYLDPRFKLETAEPDDIQKIEQYFEGINNEENELEEISGINDVNQNLFDIFKEREKKEEKDLKKNDSKKKHDRNGKILKLKKKSKKSRQLSSFKKNGKQKSNLAAKKLFIRAEKEIKKEKANQKGSSKSNEFLTKKTKRNSFH